MKREYGCDVEGWEAWEVPLAKNLVNKFKNEPYVSKEGVVCDWRLLLRHESFGDLMHEVLTHWSLVRGAFDASRGASKKTYMWRVVENKLLHIVEKLMSNKRRASAEAVSLDEHISEDEDSPTYADQLPADENYVNNLHLKIDVDEAVKKLPHKREKMCRLKKKGFTNKEIAEALRIPETTIRDEFKRIGVIFREKGLHNYLK